MKKLILVFMSLLALSISMIGCGTESKADKLTEKDDSIAAEENLLSVEVTLPSTFFEGQDMKVVEEDAKDNGVTDFKINEDGSVTYKMSKSTHKELLAGLKESTDESIVEILNDKESFPSFSEIKYNDDLTEFNVMVDASLYNPFEGFVVMSFYMIGNMYQAMDCVDTNDINTTVNFIDKDTNEVIESGNSSEMDGDE